LVFFFSFFLSSQPLTSTLSVRCDWVVLGCFGEVCMPSALLPFPSRCGRSETQSSFPQSSQLRSSICKDRSTKRNTKVYQPRAGIGRKKVNQICYVDSDGQTQPTTRGGSQGNEIIPGSSKTKTRPARPDLRQAARRKKRPRKLNWPCHGASRVPLLHQTETYIHFFSASI
jgi:hypothetical protein